MTAINRQLNKHYVPTFSVLSLTLIFFLVLTTGKEADVSNNSISMDSEYKPVERSNEDYTNTEDHNPLLSNQDVQFLVSDYELQQATASTFGCVINLANTILGTGMLAMVNKLYYWKNRH